MISQVLFVTFALYKVRGRQHRQNRQVPTSTGPLLVSAFCATLGYQFFLIWLPAKLVHTATSPFFPLDNRCVERFRLSLQNVVRGVRGFFLEKKTRTPLVLSKNLPANRASNVYFPPELITCASESPLSEVPLVAVRRSGLLPPLSSIS